MPVEVKGLSALEKRLASLSPRVRQRLGTYMNVAGDAGVTAQRDGHTYKDQTGNLTSSVSYDVTDGGVVIGSGVAGSQSAGNQAAESALKRLRDNNPRHTTLTLVAGMEYAQYVQARGYDVLLSGARAAVQKLRNLISKTK